MLKKVIDLLKIVVNKYELKHPGDMVEKRIFMGTNRREAGQIGTGHQGKV